LRLEEIRAKVYAIREFVEGSRSVFERLEGVSGSMVIPLLFTPAREIDVEAVDSVYEVLRELSTPIDRLSVVLESWGGDPDQAYLVARYLQRISRELVVYVPRYAKSAATLIACAASEIVMLPIAELGPIDPVTFDPRARRYVPTQSLIDTVRLILETRIPKELASEVLDRLPITEIGDYKRVQSHIVDMATKLLREKMFRGDESRAREVAQALASYKHHGAAIPLSDAESLGLVVRQATREEEELLWRLRKLWADNVIEFERLNLVVAEPSDLRSVEFSAWRGLGLTVLPDWLIKDFRGEQEETLA